MLHVHVVVLWCFGNCIGALTGSVWVMSHPIFETHLVTRMYQCVPLFMYHTKGYEKKIPLDHTSVPTFVGLCPGPI